jgi:hypothetical protein
MTCLIQGKIFPHLFLMHMLMQAVDLMLLKMLSVYRACKTSLGSNYLVDF